MSNRRPVGLTTTEVLAAVRALGTVVRTPCDVTVSDAQLEDAVRALFQLLYEQQQTFGWKPSGLTLAPWAVEILARLLGTSTPAALPKPEKRTVKASLRPPRPRAAGEER